MTHKFFFLLLFTIFIGCAKLPISATPSNDSILSGGMDKPKPNLTDTVNPDNPTAEPDYAENSNIFLGMPFIASIDAENSFNNYFINRTYLTTSFNKTKSIPNWVAWHLTKDHIGTQPRTPTFYTDPLVPFSWIWIDNASYTNSGFSRGHNCPSGDRTLNAAMNLETFYMTNIIPQGQTFNAGSWSTLEDYIRSTIKTNNYEAYIYMGNFGIEGSSSTSESKRKIVNNTGRTYPDGSRDSIWVPKYVFKIVLFIPEGTDDMNRIVANNGNGVKVLAVLFNNDNTSPTWTTRITDIETIEAEIAKCTNIEEFSTYPATNPLNPSMVFLSKIKDPTIKAKLKKMKWVP